jgi:hypothetical protein
MNRRRIAWLLDRFSLFIFGPYVEAWEAWPQERIDAETDATMSGWDRPGNIVRPG